MPKMLEGKKIETIFKETRKNKLKEKIIISNIENERADRFKMLKILEDKNFETIRTN